MGDAPALRFVTFLAPSMEPVYRAIAGWVGRRLDVPVTLRTARAHTDLERDTDVGFLCSPVYLWLADRPRPLMEAVAAPLLAGDRFGGKPVSFSDVIVSPGSTARSFGELRGAAFAYNEPWSHSGYGCVRYRLATVGAVEGFFGRVVESGHHRSSIRLVADGSVDAAAIDTQVLAIEMREHPDLAKRVRVIDALGPYPIQPVAVSTHLPAELRDALRAAFVDLHEEPDLGSALRFGMVESFVAITDQAYDETRAMQREAQTSGLRGLGTPVSPVPGTPGP